MTKKVKQFSEISHIFRDGMTIMIGGFMSCGAPEKVIDSIIESGVKDLTIIVNDTGTVDRGIGKLIANKRVKKVIASHIGTNPETGRQMTEGEIEVSLVPQGTLIERIRAGGSGLGGFLTPTGVGTIIEEGKQKMTIDGKTYLLELPIRADIALLRASVADEIGNAFYKGTTRNFNTWMAFAAETVVLEAEEIVPMNSLEPETVMTPGALVHYIIKGDKVCK